MRQKDIEKKIAELHATDSFPWNTENDNRASKRREKKAIAKQQQLIESAKKRHDRARQA